MSLTGRRAVTFIGAVLAVLIVAVLAGCTPSHNQSTFDTSGPVAESQLRLFYWIFWASVFVFVSVVGVLMYAVIRYRRRPGDADPPQFHGNTPLEIAWTLAPAIVLAIVAVPTIDTIFDNANSPHPVEEGGMVVDVVAHQWWWEFTYKHPDDADTVVKTANVLHIPVAEVVNITLDSKDVLHSFWIPKLAGKVDVVPNNLNKMWILADKAGEYYGQCAEFCGVAHANMRFRVIAEPRAEFDAWLRKEAGPGFESIDPLVMEGKALFEGTAGCFACHTISGSKRSRGTRGPNLTHLASRGHIAAGLVENTQPNLKRWIENPDAIKPGNVMGRDAAVYLDPDKKLTEVEIDALVFYLMSLD